MPNLRVNGVSHTFVCNEPTGGMVVRAGNGVESIVALVVTGSAGGTVGVTGSEAEAGGAVTAVVVGTVPVGFVVVLEMGGDPEGMMKRGGEWRQSRCGTT